MPLSPDRQLNELIASPERGLDGVVEKPRPVQERPPTQMPAQPTAPAITQTTDQPAPRPADERLRQIEAVLEEDLGDIYFQLTPEQQRRFKAEGEKTALRISQLLSQLKIKVGQIAQLIQSWLKTIPGVNRFFLEQETKIKTDKIVNRFLKR